LAQADLQETMGGDRHAVLQKLSGGENCILGVIAGALEVCINQPQLYFKNARQQNIPLTLNPKILYRGLTISALNMGGLTGIQFWLSGAIQKAFTGGTRDLTAGEEFAAGFLGGAISGLPCCIWELIMIQQQRFGGTLMGTPGRMMSSQGASILLRGLTTSAGREGIFTMGYLGVAPVVQRTLTKDYGVSTYAAGFGGAIIAGVFASAITHPLDTIKTCMQGDIEGAKFTNVRGTYSTILAEGGPTALFKGWNWRVSRMICAMFIINEAKVALAPVVFSSRFDTQGQN